MEKKTTTLIYPRSLTSIAIRTRETTAFVLLGMRRVARKPIFGVTQTRLYNQRRRQKAGKNRIKKVDRLYYIAQAKAVIADLRLCFGI